MSLKSVVEKNTTRAGRIFDLVIVFLIVASLLSYSVETLPNQPEEWRTLLRVAEVAIVTLFTVEYVLRIIVATRKWGFIFSFYGMIDLAAILPFYIATGLDLRAIRIVRLLRLFRAFKLVRYSKAIRLFHRAFSIAKEELVLFFLVAMMMMFFAAAGIHYFENEAQPEAFSSVFSSFWWAVVTLTTLGYGDVYPITVGGRVFTFVVLMIGLGTIAVPSGIVASALGQAREMDDDET